MKPNDVYTDKLQELQRLSFDSGESLRSALAGRELRQLIEVCAEKYLHRKVSGCGNCYEDAFFRLRKLKAEEMKESMYKLNGGILYDAINQDSDLILSNNNMNDRLAAYHLLSNPDIVNRFVKPTPDEMPAHIESLVAKYGDYTAVLRLIKREPVEKAEAEAEEAKKQLETATANEKAAKDAYQSAKEAKDAELEQFVADAEKAAEYADLAAKAAIKAAENAKQLAYEASHLLPQKLKTSLTGKELKADDAKASVSASSRRAKSAELRAKRLQEEADAQAASDAQAAADAQAAIDAQAQELAEVVSAMRESVANGATETEVLDGLREMGYTDELIESIKQSIFE